MANSKLKKTTKKSTNINREFWADLLRALSIFMVVVIHTSAKVLYEWGSVQSGELSIISWNFANLLNSFSRISVPLFVMLSGAFLLNKKENLKQFLQNRIPRILLPWVFWGTIQLFYNYNFSLNEIINNNLVGKIADTYFGGFWFMPMILGLYLLTPIIKPFIKTAKTKDFMYFFTIWFIFASLIPTLNTSFGINISYQLPIFIQYLGYFVAGHFLTHKVKIKKLVLNQTKYLYIISSLLIALGTFTLTKLNSQFNDSLYEYVNILVFVATISGFVTLKSIFENKKLTISNNIKQKIARISQFSFGIFLSHALILDVLSKGKLGFTIHGTIANPLATLPLTIIVVFTTSLTVIILLNKFIPKLSS